MRNIRISILLLRVSLVACAWTLTLGQGGVITPRYAILQRTHYEWLPQITDYDMDQAFVVAEHVIKAKRAHEEKIFKGGRIMQPGQYPSSARHQHLLAPNKKASKMERATEKFEEATNVIKDMFTSPKKHVLKPPTRMKVPSLKAALPGGLPWPLQCWWMPGF
ncbi:hypothetical protein JTE90_000447 [Oedothorax gibbosus]|uniref:Uncharacterized protein n=1 Tax=Oedothorax gibbosus TaxID=931172 RepID=A0AAV6UG86_9ARAC|nr:hypothetical protein JTE90_000447 [Oedothorax gibbosus]